MSEYQDEFEKKMADAADMQYKQYQEEKKFVKLLIYLFSSAFVLAGIAAIYSICTYNAVKEMKKGKKDEN